MGSVDSDAEGRSDRVLASFSATWGRDIRIPNVRLVAWISWSLVAIFTDAAVVPARGDALVYGSAGDVDAFHAEVDSCDCAATFAEAWDALVTTEAEVRLYVTRDLQRHVRTGRGDSRNLVFVDMLDSLGTGAQLHLVDLEDLAAFPRAIECSPDSGGVRVRMLEPAWASSRCSILLHVLSEARRMAEGEPYAVAHAAAIEDENRFRAEAGQTVRILRRLSGAEEWGLDDLWGTRGWAVSNPQITLFEGGRSEVFEAGADGRVLPPRFETHEP